MKKIPLSRVINSRRFCQFLSLAIVKMSSLKIMKFTSHPLQQWALNSPSSCPLFSMMQMVGYYLCMDIESTRSLLSIDLSVYHWGRNDTSPSFLMRAKHSPKIPLPILPFERHFQFIALGNNKVVYAAWLWLPLVTKVSRHTNAFSALLLCIWFYPLPSNISILYLCSSCVLHTMNIECRVNCSFFDNLTSGGGGVTIVLLANGDGTWLPSHHLPSNRLH